MNGKEFSSKRRKKITYPNLDSALRPVPHDPSMPASLAHEDGFASLADELVLTKRVALLLAIQQILSMSQKKI